MLSLTGGLYHQVSVKNHPLYSYAGVHTADHIRVQDMLEWGQNNGASNRQRSFMYGPKLKGP